MGLLKDIIKLPFSVLEDTVEVVSEGDLMPDKTLDNVGDILDDLI